MIKFLWRLFYGINDVMLCRIYWNFYKVIVVFELLKIDFCMKRVRIDILRKIIVDIMFYVMMIFIMLNFILDRMF